MQKAFLGITAHVFIGMGLLYPQPAETFNRQRFHKNWLALQPIQKGCFSKNNVPCITVVFARLLAAITKKQCHQPATFATCRQPIAPL